MNSDQLRELADRLSDPCSPDDDDLETVADFLRQCAEQRSVAYKHTEPDGSVAYFGADEAPCEKCVPLYAAPVPPQREPSAWKRLRDAGFTRRDNRIECDECGKKITPQFLPIHECEAQSEPKRELREKQIADACLSYRHDFGLLNKDEQARLMLEARDWERAFRKEWQREPLSDDYILDTANEIHRAMPVCADEQEELLQIARAVERAHGIGGRDDTK